MPIPVPLILKSFSNSKTNYIINKILKVSSSNYSLTKNHNVLGGIIIGSFKPKYNSL